MKRFHTKSNQNRIINPDCRTVRGEGEWGGEIQSSNISICLEIFVGNDFHSQKKYILKTFYFCSEKKLILKTKIRKFTEIKSFLNQKGSTRSYNHDGTIHFAVL